MTSRIDGLVGKLRAGLAKHRDKPLPVILEKIGRAAAGTALAPWMLRACDSVGPRARTLGRTIVDNRGRITIGSDFGALSQFCPVELASGPEGVLAIGDGVIINYGTTITATKEIRLGDRVSIGPYCILCDSDAPAPLDAPGSEPGKPIVLEEGVWLAGRVTVLPGAHIGAGATVSAGSIVRGYIPPGTVAAGIPAKPLRVPRPSREGR